MLVWQSNLYYPFVLMYSRLLWTIKIDYSLCNSNCRQPANDLRNLPGDFVQQLGWKGIFAAPP